jgi:hypothetical protein
MKEALPVLSKEELDEWFKNQKDITAEFLTRVGWEDVLAKNDTPVSENMIRIGAAWAHTNLDPAKNIDVVVKQFFNHIGLSWTKDVARVLVEYCPTMISVAMYQKREGNPSALQANL